MVFLSVSLQRLVDQSILLRIIRHGLIFVFGHRLHPQQIVERVVICHSTIADERLTFGHSLRPCGIIAVSDAGKFNGGQITHILPDEIQRLAQGRTAGFIHGSDFPQRILRVTGNRFSAKPLELVIYATAHGAVLPRLKRFSEQTPTRIPLIQTSDKKQKLLKLHGGDIFACAECATQNAVSHSGRRKTCPDLWLVLNISHVSNSKMGED